MIRLPAAAMAALVGALAILCNSVPLVLAGEPDTDQTVTAYVDGTPISIKDISRYFCDDFAYPVITCSTLSLMTTARSVTLSLLGVDYVTIYDKTGFGGTFMNLSQDYSSLLAIGWDDRVSSFRVRNSETGQFFTNWFNSGSSWPFCCNTQMSSLGAYDNTFSSVERT